MDNFVEFAEALTAAVQGSASEDDCASLLDNEESAELMCYIRDSYCGFTQRL